MVIVSNNKITSFHFISFVMTVRVCHCERVLTRKAICLLRVCDLFRVSVNEITSLHCVSFVMTFCFELAIERLLHCTPFHS